MQFCADISKKSKSILAIYIYAPQRSRYAPSENYIFYYALTYCFGDIRAWSRRILLNFCRVSIFFDILIANTLRTVAQTTINHIVFWKSVMRTFRCIYVNCFNRLRFLAEVSTKLQKFNSNSIAFIFVFENSQSSFLCVPPFGPFWSVKYLNFGQKLPIR